MTEDVSRDDSIQEKMKADGAERQLGGDQSDWLIALFVLASVIIVLIVYVVGQEKWPRVSYLLAGVLGAVIGWACGIFATPYNVIEKDRLGEIGRIIAGVVTGYLVAKFDRIFDLILPASSGGEAASSSVLTHLAVSLTMFISVSVVTYVTRSYDPSNPSSTTMRKLKNSISASAATGGSRSVT